MELVPIAEAQPVLAFAKKPLQCKDCASRVQWNLFQLPRRSQFSRLQNILCKRKYTTGGVPKVGTPENDLYYFKISILLFYRFSHNISALCPRFSTLPALRALLAAELLIGIFPVHH
jgi:hypothetical protein